MIILTSHIQSTTIFLRLGVRSNWTLVKQSGPGKHLASVLSIVLNTRSSAKSAGSFCATHLEVDSQHNKSMIVFDQKRKDKTNLYYNKDTVTTKMIIRVGGRYSATVVLFEERYTARMCKKLLIIKIIKCEIKRVLFFGNEGKK